MARSDRHASSSKSLQRAPFWSHFWQNVLFGSLARKVTSLTGTCVKTDGNVDSNFVQRKQRKFEASLHLIISIKYTEVLSSRCKRLVQMHKHLDPQGQCFLAREWTQNPPLECFCLWGCPLPQQPCCHHLPTLLCNSGHQCNGSCPSSHPRSQPSHGIQAMGQV